MTIIDDMAKAIKDFEEKHPDPPVNQINMHPDDFRRARRDQYMYLGNPPEPYTLFGLKIVIDADAPRVQKMSN